MSDQTPDRKPSDEAVVGEGLGAEMAAGGGDGASGGGGEAAKQPEQGGSGDAAAGQDEGKGEGRAAETADGPSTGPAEGAPAGAAGAPAVEQGGGSEGGRDFSGDTGSMPTPEKVTLDESEISSDMQAEMAAAMSAATGGGSGSAGVAAGGGGAAAGGAGSEGWEGHHHEKPSDEAIRAAEEKAKRPVRGPRVVESGREYREGIVVSVGPDDVFVEFGPKSLGVLPRAQFRDPKTGEEPDLPAVGSTFRVAVDKYNAEESLYMCSRPGAVQKAEWELLQPGQVVEARVTGKNKGGLELEVAGHKAFMPASLVSDTRIEDLSVFVGEKMTCSVTRVDRSGRGNITLSRREILAEEKKQRAEELKGSLKEGDVLEGTVKKVMNFGAFVDIGGIDGLVHVSDLSHDRVRKVEDHVKEGAQVRVKVLKLDWEQGRHSLGMKQLQDDPFEVGLSEINEGDVVSARVVKLADFGAFLEIASGVEGLCHISELDWRRVEKVSDAVQPDEVVNAKVLKIEKDSRKISLSIKQAKDRPERPGGRGGGGGGRGRGRGDRDDRSPDEILKETPELRRMREKAKQREKERAGGGGLGESGGMGLGLGDLKL